MSEWWINNSGLNLLKGVEGDDTNPPRLADHIIVAFLRQHPQARTSFNRLVPNMLPDEQERLNALAGSATFLQVDNTTLSDSFQASQNKAGIRTTGRRGGQRIGGNN